MVTAFEHCYREGSFLFFFKEKIVTLNRFAALGGKPFWAPCGSWAVWGPVCLCTPHSPLLPLTHSVHEADRGSAASFWSTDTLVSVLCQGWSEALVLLTSPLSGFLVLTSYTWIVRANLLALSCLGYWRIIEASVSQTHEEGGLSQGDRKEELFFPTLMWKGDLDAGVHWGFSWSQC